MLGVILVQRWDRARTGTFLNGWRAGRTLPISLIAVLANADLFAIGAHYALGGMTWVPLALALVATAFGVAVSYAWQRVYLRELRVQGR
jgi:CHASE2 domain-containing sensor protein